MAESELISSYQLPNGERIQKFRASDGEISYRRSDGTFVSPSVGKGIEESAERDIGDDRQVTFVVEPQTQQDRQESVEKRYPRLNNTTNINADRIDPSDPKFVQVTKGWMRNDTLRRQIENDPLLKTDAERRKALEARARQIAHDLRGVENNKEAIQILRKYGVES